MLHPRFRSTRQLVALVAVATSSVASGEILEPECAANLTFENDLFFGSDRHYTNGIQYEWVRKGVRDGHKAEVPNLIAKACESLGCDGAPLIQVRSRIGQLMYTPENISVSTPQLTDRPWAGMAYFSREYIFSSNPDKEHVALTAQVGLVGPAALAKQTQTWVHDTFSGETPRGWSNQIGTELGLLLMLEKKRVLDSFSGKSSSGWHHTTSTHWRVAVGNITTFAGAGVAYRLGSNPQSALTNSGGINIKKTDPVLTTMSNLEGSPASERDTRSGCLVDWLECSLTASLEARVVAHSIFLDGPTFSNGASVKRQPFVMDAALEARLTFPRTKSASQGPWFVQFRATRRSAEFKTARERSHAFGALTVGRELY